MAILVPGRRCLNALLWSPSPLIVTRRYGGLGSAESEHGCACHQRSVVRKRHWKNWPPDTASLSRLPPQQMTEITPRASPPTSTTSSPTPQQPPARRAILHH